MTYEELIAELNQGAIVDKERTENKERMLNELNAIRDQHATVAAKERFGIEPEMYIRTRRGKTYQVKSLSFGSLGKWSFTRGDFVDDESTADIVAECWPILATGKPAMQRGRGGNASETVRLRAADGTVIVPKSEIVQKSKRSESSEAKRKLANLSDDQLESALKAAGIK